MSREAMKQALEALEHGLDYARDEQFENAQRFKGYEHLAPDDAYSVKLIEDAITALRQALEERHIGSAVRDSIEEFGPQRFARAMVEQPADEPVAWVCYGSPGKRDVDFEESDINDLPIGTPLYTRPQPAAWVGLAGEEYDWDIERCRAYAEQLRDKTRANTAEHAAQAIEWLLAQLASYQIIGRNQEPYREWVGLTDGEAYRILEDKTTDWMQKWCAIEAKLKEKNT